MRMTSSFDASGEFTCSQPFSSEVVSVEVDHYYDPMNVMYCPYPMFLIHFGTSGLRPSGELICSESFFAEVVSAKVDHYSNLTTIMYFPDPMVLIYFWNLGLWHSSFLILSFHFTRSNDHVLSRVPN